MTRTTDHASAPPEPEPRTSPLHLVAGQAPGWLWCLTEPTRCVVDLGQFAMSRSLLRGAPSGDGHPVLVLPGLLAGDSATAPLRRFLTGLGYDVHGWRLGANLGPTAQVVRGVRALLRELTDGHGGPISLVGWSLGGIFARELAREAPELVRQVITLGSPYAMTDLRQTRAKEVYQLLTRFFRHDVEHPLPERARQPVPVPATSLYSRTDGIVAWETCIEEPGPLRENVAVASSHLGFGCNTSVLWVVADRLAQRAGEWAPFRPPPGLVRMYPKAA
jgi:pimeloyl-ACP methyl ester carboxylesterase